MPFQTTPATDSAAELHRILGDDVTATFESNPTFIESNPTGTASSENLEEQRPGAGEEFQAAPKATKGAGPDAYEEDDLVSDDEEDEDLDADDEDDDSDDDDDEEDEDLDEDDDEDLDDDDEDDLEDDDDEDDDEEDEDDDEDEE